MSTGTSGHGTTIAGSTLGTVAQVRSISVGDVTVNPIDITNMDSTDQWSEFIAGIKDAGEIGLDLVYTKAEAADLYTNAGVTDTYTITLPDSSTFACSGFISGLGMEVPFDDAISNTATFKLSGSPTFTAST